MSVYRIAEIISNLAKSENDTLYKIAGKGIYHMPERAFVYECGKAIMANSSEIFGGNAVWWLPEIDLGNGGPSDLFFELESGYKIVIEFKLRNTMYEYEKDIIKLSKIEDRNTVRLFCALVDVFDSKLPDDGRQGYIENLSEYNVQVLSKTVFPTTTHSKSPISCVVCIWSVGFVPDIQ